MNILLPFVYIVFSLFIGELISSITKVKLPSMFISAIVFLVGFWTFFPKTLLHDAGISKELITLSIYMLIVNVGTLISLEELKRQWKIVLIVLSAMFGAAIIIMTIGRALIGVQLAAVGTPPLLGGLVSTVLMQDASLKAGLENAAVVAISVFVMQSFVGYPLTSIFLKKEGKQLLEQLRNGTLSHNKQKIKESESSKLLDFLPDYWGTPIFGLLRLALLATLSVLVSTWLTHIGINLHPAVVCLIFGVLAKLTGLVEKNTLQKSNSLAFLNLVLMANILDGLKITTPQNLLAALVPCLVIILLGVVGLFILSLITSKLLKVSFNLAFSTALTALYGFPGDMIITQEISKALTNDPHERQELEDHMLPSMLIGGFVSVTIVSVIVASYFIPFVVGK